MILSSDFFVSITLATRFTLVLGGSARETQT